MLPHDFVDWNILPDDKRIFKVRNLMKARKKLERGEMEDAYRSLIENKTRDFLESKPDNFFFFLECGSCTNKRRISRLQAN